MRRITISLPDDLAVALEREAGRRRTPVSQVAREALEQRLGAGRGRILPFAGIGRSGHHTTARDVERILDDEWGSH